MSAAARPGASTPHHNAGFQKLARPSVTPPLTRPPEFPKAGALGGRSCLWEFCGHVRGSGVCGSLRSSALRPGAFAFRVFSAASRFPAVPCGSLRYALGRSSAFRPGAFAILGDPGRCGREARTFSGSHERSQARGAIGQKMCERLAASQAFRPLRFDGGCGSPGAFCVTLWGTLFVRGASWGLLP